MSLQGNDRNSGHVRVLFNPDVDLSLCSIQLRFNCDIRNMIGSSGIQQNRTMDAAERKEIKLRLRIIPGVTRKEILIIAGHISRRDAIERKPAVHAHDQLVFCFPYKRCDIELKW